MAKRGRPRTHGESTTRIYGIWNGMRARCEKEHNPRYEDYGGRGITVCPEWQDYTTFRDWAYANGYSDDLTIDRIDNDKGYSPDNCRWATMTEQIRNRSCAWTVTIDGVTKPAIEWCKEYGVPYNVASARRALASWSDIERVTKPVRKKAM